MMFDEGEMNRDLWWVSHFGGKDSLEWILPCRNGEQLKCPLRFLALIGVSLETLQAEFPSFAAIQGFPLKGCPWCDGGLLAAFLTRSLPPRVTDETVTQRGTPHFWAGAPRGA